MKLLLETVYPLAIEKNRNTISISLRKMARLEWILSQIDARNALLFFVVIVLAAVMKSWAARPKNLPPYPATPFPLIGHLPYMKVDPRGTITKWSQEKGDMFSVWFGNRFTVFLNSYDVIKEAFVEHADVFSDKSLNILLKYKGIKEGLGVAFSSGKTWNVQRTVTQKILRQFGMGKNFLAQSILEEVKGYLDQLASFKEEPREIRTLTNNSIANNICSIVLGRRFDYDDDKFSSLMKLLGQIFQSIGKVNPFAFHPLVKYLPGDIFGSKKIMAIDSRIHEEIGRVHIENAKAKVDSTDETDSFILAYLRDMKVRQGDAQDGRLNELHLQYTVFQLFLAGTDTTSTTILWFMLYMLHNPDIQTKIYEEIAEVVGMNRFPNMADKENLNLLNASIMETQRLASIVPWNSARMTSADIVFRGYFIPKGTVIHANLDSVLHDLNVWKDPLKFNPDNFLNETGGLFIPEQFIPFSLGRRICVGEPLAKMELFLYLSSILQRFELKPADLNNLPPLEYQFGATCPPKPFLIKFVERHL